MKKNKAAGITYNGRTYLAIDVLVRLIKDIKKEDIKAFRKASRILIQQLLDEGRDFDIRATKKMHKDHEKTITKVYDLLIERLSDGDDALTKLAGQDHED